MCVMHMSLALSRPSRPAGVIRHKQVLKDGSLHIVTRRIDEYGVVRRADVVLSAE